MTSAAVQASGPVMWCAMLKAAMAGPAPWVAAHGGAGRGAQQVQRDVAAAGGHRVQEHDGGGHGEDRDG